MKLTEKQKKFCDFYIETGNASEAARKAGYSEKTAFRIGQENLQKPAIQNFTQERIAAKDAERIATQDEVLQFLTSVMRGKVTEEVIGFDQLGTILRADKNASVKDRAKAAELLAKRYGLLIEKVDAEIKGIKIVDDVK